MRRLAWFIGISAWISFAAFLHYTLPQHDIVRINKTDVNRVDPGINRIFFTSAGAGNPEAVNRDLLIIGAIRPNGDASVYRNEDTGWWGWPPYFKLDSQNVQTLAHDLISDSDNPKWVAVKHYGWRLEGLSTFPNVLSVRPVSGPDVRITPWTSIIVITLIVVLGSALWIRWRRFRARRIDPALESIDDQLDAAGSWTNRQWKRLFGNKQE